MRGVVPTGRILEAALAYGRATDTLRVTVILNRSYFLPSIMTIELSKEARQEALASLQKYFKENLDAELGNLAAGNLLNFIVEEIGPCIYNRAVADAQQRMQVRLSELDTEVFADEFQYWRKTERRKR